MLKSLGSIENSDRSIVLTLDRLIEILIQSISSFEDIRIGTNTKYEMLDIGLAAFSVFFTQSPSFLDHQIQMQKAEGKNNAKSIFRLHEIPTDNHIRKILDGVTPEKLFPVFDQVYTILENSKILDQFTFLENQLLFAFDATGHFSSNKIHCDKCFTMKHSNGETTYLHKAITPVIVQPGNNKVIALPPEYILPQDGAIKQDSELSAMKRWLAKHAQTYSNRSITALGDAIYSNQPNIKRLLEHKFNYIFGVKTGSHNHLFEVVNMIRSAGKIKTIVQEKFQGKSKRFYHYFFVNGISLRKENSITTNYAELVIKNETGEITKIFSCITNHEINDTNIFDIIRAHRSRWKIENENNNELKKRGYNLEHNFGHGKLNLTSTLLTMNLIAFLFHTVLEIVDKKYMILRKHLGAKKVFFQDIRALTKYKYFQSWNVLLQFMLEALEIEFTDSS